MIIAFLRFEIRRILRSRRYLIMGLVFPVVIYLLVSHAASAGGNTVISGIPFDAYYMVSMATFGAILATFSAAAPRLAEERTSGWTRAMRATPLSGRAYIIGKLGISLFMTLPTIILVCLAAEFEHGIGLSWWQWLATVGLLWIGALPFAAFGIFTGLMWSADTIGPVIGGGMSFLSFFGGLFTPVTILGATFRHIAEFLPTYHLGSLGWAILRGQAPALQHFAVLLGYTCLCAALALWAYRREQRTSVV